MSGIVSIFRMRLNMLSFCSWLGYKAAIADARKFDGANPKNRTLREATSAVYEDRQRRIWDKGRRALMTAERARPDAPNSNVGKARAVFAAQEEARQETYRREMEKGQKDTQLGQDKKLRISRTVSAGELGEACRADGRMLIVCSGQGWHGGIRRDRRSRHRHRLP